MGKLLQESIEYTNGLILALDKDQKSAISILNSEILADFILAMEGISIDIGIADRDRGRAKPSRFEIFMLKSIRLILAIVLKMFIFLLHRISES